MNKVISIHLKGVAFQLEESGYDALRSYLDQAERQLGANPDRAEIMADIEQAIADKFRALLSPARNVILAAEVAEVIKEMGPVNDGSEPADAKASTGPAPSSTTGKDQEQPEPPPPPRRLYRLKEGAMLGGVCNGLAAYLGLDVTLLRLVVALLVFVSFGSVAVAYIVALIVIPRANTAEEKKAAAGASPTAQEFIRRAKQGYYEGLKSFPDREARRAWKKKFKQEMKEWKHSVRDEFRWTPPPPPVVTAPPPGYHVVLPVLSTLTALFFFFAAIAVVSLVATGAVFGVPLPGRLPVWAGIVIIVLVYKLVISPLKAVRRHYDYPGYSWPVYWHPFLELWKTIIGILILVFFLFVADRLIPGFHQVLLDFRAFLHHAFDSLAQWWNQKGST